MLTYPAVLYVEDDSNSRIVMDMILTSYMKLQNVSIWENSANFEQNLAHLHFRPDIILLDIHMTPLNGFEMLRILRRYPEYQALPIVALTASVMNDEIKQLREAGFNGVISKPIDIKTFPDAVQQILRRQEVWRVTAAR